MKVEQTILSVSDLQYPFIDKKVWGGVLDFAKALKPTGVIINGDGFDFYDLSKFDKDPARLGRMQLELEGFQDEVLSPLVRVTPKAEWRKYTKGNHEERVQKYLWHQAPALSSLHGLKVSELLGLGKHNMAFVDAFLPLGKHLVVMHGHIVRRHSAVSAKAHWERYGTSMVIGHTHRLGSFMVRDLRGVHEAVEQGCLCDLNPEYEEHPNWQQGFVVIHVFSDGTFSTQMVKVVNGKFLLYGRERFAIAA